MQEPISASELMGDSVIRKTIYWPGTNMSGLTNHHCICFANFKYIVLRESLGGFSNLAENSA